jgi:S1-C subfamily serine protease
MIPRMTLSTFRFRLFGAAVALALLPLAAAAASLDSLRRSAVKIYVTVQRYDYMQPWQATPPGYGNGSGFIIEKRRILTNAHVISDTTFIEVQRDGDPRRFPARVAFVAHDCDLALLAVDDPAFFAETRPIRFSDALPRLNDEVIALGFPMGGTRLSLTRGVVSRIDYSAYSHSDVDSHLIVQTDAAINPGNSGGPVLLDGRVIGVAFQGVAGAQNLGYAIPLPVIHHVLRDVEDGRYHGYPELGLRTFDTRNPALRRALRLAPSGGGAAVDLVDPFGAAQGLLHNGDVLLRVEGLEIATDGSVVLDGNTVEFGELVERRQWGERIGFDVSRSGTVQRVEVPLRNPADPFCYRMLYDEAPEYHIMAGLVFMPVTRNLLGSIGSDLENRAVHNLFFLAAFAKLDGLARGRTQFVVLANRLPHTVNTYDEGFRYQVVTEANGRTIGALRDLVAALQQPTNGFHVVRFEGSENPLVLDAAQVREADDQIRRRYEIPAMTRLR